MTQPVHCEIAVIGAGVVGVATALWLRRQGYQVLLLEREAIAAGASYGNAGTLAPYGVMPIAQPSLLKAIPSLLFSPDSPFVINWARLPRLMPWLLRFLNECRASRCEANTLALTKILQHTYSGYAPLLADCPQANQHLRHNGCIYAYGTQQGFAGAQAAIELRRALNIPQQVLNATDIEQLEPALAGKAVAGILFPESSHMDDPRAFIEALAAPLVAEGALHQATITGLQRHSDGLHLLSVEGLTYRADRVVLCGGLVGGVGASGRRSHSAGYRARLSPRIRPARHLAQSPLLPGGKRVLHDAHGRSPEGGGYGGAWLDQRPGQSQTL